MTYTSIHVYVFTFQAVRFQGLGLGFLCAHFDMGSAATAVKMRVARMPELLDRGDAIYTSAGGCQGTFFPGPNSPGTGNVATISRQLYRDEYKDALSCGSSHGASSCLIWQQTSSWRLSRRSKSG